IMDLIIKKDLDLYLRATNGLRVDRITTRFLEKFKRAGGDYVAYGIESGDQEVLDRIPKRVTIDQIRRAVKLTKKAGLRVSGFFIFGLLGDTPETMRKTIEFAKELDLDVAVFNILAPYPGTELWDIIHKSEGRILVEDYDEFHHTANRALFTLPNGPDPDEVVKAYRRAHREFYFRPRYALKQLLKVRSASQIRELIGGVKSLLGLQFEES
ncbi:MAG: B12-binding domain-containing radical SAM protein, partial [Candidatus Bathyarchaeia archaeon]